MNQVLMSAIVKGELRGIEGFDDKTLSLNQLLLYEGSLSNATRIASRIAQASLYIN